MRIIFSIVTAMLALLGSAAAWSHHSFSAEFDVGRPVEITGAITEVEWTNPHAWLHLAVEDEQGNVVHWAVEMLGVNTLVRSGMTPQTVKAGDVLTITGYGSRDGSSTANASSVTRTETGEKLWASAGN
jgi:DNA/RNA endonuclease YhcR with UshA esterase domain